MCVALICSFDKKWPSIWLVLVMEALIVFVPHLCHVPKKYGSFMYKLNESVDSPHNNVSKLAEWYFAETVVYRQPP